MKKLILLLTTITFSCSEPKTATHHNWTLKIIESEIDVLTDRFNTLSKANFLRSNSTETINNLISTYNSFVEDSLGLNIKNHKAKLDSLFKLIRENTTISSDLEAYKLENINIDENYKLNIRISELSVLQQLYDYNISRKLIFNKHRIIQVPGKNGFTDLYFATSLDSINSNIFFASVDTTNYNYIYDTLDKKIILANGYYSIKLLDKKNDGKGVIKIKWLDGSDDLYPFYLRK